MGRPKGSKNKSKDREYIVNVDSNQGSDNNLKKKEYNPHIKVKCINANKHNAKSKYLTDGEEYECRYEIDTSKDILYSIKVARSEWQLFSKDRFEKVEE